VAKPHESLDLTTNDASTLHIGLSGTDWQSVLRFLAAAEFISCRSG
jgi:hypothetical protein